MNPLHETGAGGAAALYLDFGLHQTGDSPCFREWALGLAGDPEVVRLVDTLPPAKRQPNLVFAAARRHGAGPAPYDALRRVLLERWDDVRATVLSRSTQTNEVGRCATLLPVLASLPGPLALLEVGASAGLCLYPDRYSYRFGTEAGEVALDPADGPSPVVLSCALEGETPVPQELPEIAWRAGLDLHPLDAHDPEDRRWLETLVWPEHEDRRARLLAAAAQAPAEVPVVRGDLLTDLDQLVSEVPEDCTLVVFHSAVLAYLEERDRVHFAESMAAVPGHWLSNEGPSVVPGIAATTRGEPPAGSAVGAAPFVLGLDGRAVAWTHGHGRGVRWIAGASASVSSST